MNDPARTPNDNEPARTGERRRYLTFTLGGERYGIPLLLVKEVIEMAEPTPVPQTPAYLRGVINLRGRVISVYDLRQKLRLPTGEVGPKTAIVIVDLDDLTLGIIVDRVTSVVAFAEGDLKPAPDVSSDRDRVLTAIARRDDQMTLILDLSLALGSAAFRHPNVPPNERISK